MESLKQILLNSINSDGSINVEKVNNASRKIKWLARDFWQSGCMSGIVKYNNREYYFCMSGTILNVRLN